MNTCNYTLNDINMVPIDEAISMFYMARDRRTLNEIFSIQLQGADPMNIPYYRDFLNSKQAPVKEKKARMNKSEIETYKNLFDKALKRNGR